MKAMRDDTLTTRWKLVTQFDFFDIVSIYTPPDPQGLSPVKFDVMPTFQVREWHVVVSFIRTKTHFATSRRVMDLALIMMFGIRYIHGWPESFLY